MKRRKWTPADDEIIRNFYPDHAAADIAKAQGWSLSSLYQRARKLGVGKSDNWHQSEASGRLRKGSGAGLKTRFQKGQTPWNKGTNFSAGGRSEETRFQIGRIPHNWNPIGHERLTKEGYLQRKITDTRNTRRDYVAVHHLLWIEHNGAIPKGHAIVFKDGNKQNITLENLECVSRAELMSRNTLHRYPKEIALAIQLRGALNRKINRMTGAHDE